MNYMSELNRSYTYDAKNPLLENRENTVKSPFSMKENEEVELAYTRGIPVSLDDLLYRMLSREDIEIIKTIGLSKYITSSQILDFLNLRGILMTKKKLGRKFNKLLNYRIINYGLLKDPSVTQGLRFYEVSYLGYKIASMEGVIFTAGNRFVSRKSIFDGKTPMPTVIDVKRVLMGNQIVLSHLIRKTKMESFGIMETIHATDREKAKSGLILRTSCNIMTSESEVYFIEVVRNDQKNIYDNIAKVKRFYDLYDVDEERSFHNEVRDLKMHYVLCSESFDDNVLLAKMLKREGLLRKDGSLIFTHDLLNLGLDMEVFYTLDEEGNKMGVYLETEREVKTA